MTELEDREDTSLPAARGVVVAGRYELADALGSGRSSTVFRARDRRTGFPVAVKIVTSPEGPTVAAARVAEEARLLAKISSRHVVSAHDHGVDEVLGAFLVTDLVEGEWLASDLLGRPFFPHEVLRAARGLLSGLAAAHAEGVVHHDLRPANVIVPGDRLEAAVLVDFGVANGGDTPNAPDEPKKRMWGTARYAAPERLAGRAGDTRSDIFSAGMLLYELLGLPLDREAERVRLREGGPDTVALAVSLALVPKPLSTLLERMVAEDPVRRFATASDALAVVLDLDTAPIEEGIDPRVAPVSVRSGPRTLAPTTGPSADAPRLFRLAADPVAALRECISSLDLVLLDALVRREKQAFSAASVVAHAFDLSFRSALAAVDGAALSKAVCGALVLPRASRALVAPFGEAFGEVELDALDTELHAVLATLSALLATPRTVRPVLARVRRASARLREDPLASKGLLGTLDVAEVALSVVCEDRPARSALAEAKSIASRESSSASLVLQPLDKLARSLLIGATALHEDPELSRASLERALTLASEAKNALLEVRVLSELGRLLVLDPITRELGFGWLVRVETLVAHADAPTFAHSSYHDRGGASLLRGRYEEAALYYSMARAVLVDEGHTDAEVLTGASLVLTKLAAGDPDGASALVADFVEPRLAVTEARTAAFALLARAMVALSMGDLTRARRDVERARSYAARVVRGSQDAVGLVEIAAALLFTHVPDDPELHADERARDLSEVVRVHAGGALRFLPILRAIVSRVPRAELRQPLLAAADGALREVDAPLSGDRITQPPPAVREPPRLG